MFVDEFFWPPEVYEYTFGSFSIEEVKALDIYIDKLFASQFGESLYEDNDILLEQEQCQLPVLKQNNNSLVDKSGNNSTKNHQQIGVDSTGYHFQETENWEEEFCEDTFTMPKPVRVVPIGMTMDSFNGQKFAERVPLYHHFDAFDLSSAHVGAFSNSPSSSGGGRKGKHKKTKKNGKAKPSNVLIEDTGDRKVIRSSNGEIFMLV